VAAVQRPAEDGRYGSQLVSDSHLAALALEQGYAVCSTDHDFKRFSGVAHVNPLE
jgi:uncharacterized protein